MSTVEPVRYGTAEQLARLFHFRSLTDTLPEAHELDPVLRFLLGPVTDPAEILGHLHDELDQLWSLLTEDYDDCQLDDLTDADHDRYSFATYQQEVDHRYGLTRDRLVADVEGYVRMAREWRAQQRAQEARQGRAA